MPIRVFVYGSLKKGHGNHPLLADAKYLGRCFIEGRYRMLSLGGFPGLVQSDKVDSTKIVGEVYQINEDQLRSLDFLEGHPRFYERQKVPTPWKNAWCYFLPEGYLGGYPPVGSIWRPTEEELEWFKGHAAPAPEVAVANL